MVDIIASKPPLVNGLPHWTMALYWRVGCIAKMMVGLEKVRFQGPRRENVNRDK
jgi:hypothetical protein